MPNIKKEFHLHGTHCASCFIVIEDTLNEINLEGSHAIDSSGKKVVLELSTEEDLERVITESNAQLAELGYLITDAAERRFRPKELVLATLLGLGLWGAYLYLGESGVIGRLTPTSISVPGALLVGIVASFSSCLAVVGGIVLALSSQFGELKEWKQIQWSFHLGRLAGYALLGAMVGLLGQAFHLSTMASSILNFFAGLLMVVIGLQLLNFVPAFQGGWGRILNKVRSQDTNRPILVAGGFGVLTFFLPCGFTQSMQLVALSSGSAVMGALIMFSFAIGTFPMLYFLTNASTKIKNRRELSLIYKTIGVVVILLGLLNLQNSLQVLRLLI